MFSSEPVTTISSVTAAAAISVSSVLDCAAPIRRTCLTVCSPCASKVSSYSPGGSDGNRESPVGDVTGDFVPWRLGDDTVPFAPGRGWSPAVTRPDSLPFGFPCVMAGNAQSRAIARPRIKALTLMDPILLLGSASLARKVLLPGLMIPEPTEVLLPAVDP